MVGMGGENGPSGGGFLRRRGDAARAVGLHQGAPVGLLIVGAAHHVDVDLDAEQRARERQCGTPLAGAGFGGDAAHAGLPIEKRLGHGRVGLVAAGGADAFVLVINVGRGIEDALEAPGAIQRRRPPLPVDVAHRRRNLNLAFG